MKHLRIYENKKSENLVTNAMKEYDKICDLICEFINLEKLYPCEPIKYVIRYYFENNVNDKDDVAMFTENVNMNFKNVDGCENSMIIGKDLENLYSFIDNPEVYKNTKKYNI